MHEAVDELVGAEGWVGVGPMGSAEQALAETAADEARSAPPQRARRKKKPAGCSGHLPCPMELTRPGSARREVVTQACGAAAACCHGGWLRGAMAACGIRSRLWDIRALLCGAMAA